MKANPKPGDLYQHDRTRTVAAFVGWRRNLLSGEMLMVLAHPTFGECRWPPRLAHAYTPAANEPESARP